MSEEGSDLPIPIDQFRPVMSTETSRLGKTVSHWQDPSCRKIRELAGPLNEASDLLRKEVTRIELSLESSNLGISIWRQYAPNYAIGYAKIGEGATGRWGLGIHEISERKAYLFFDAPRQWRIEAAEHIPTLVAALAEEAELVLTNLQRRIQVLKEVLS